MTTVELINLLRIKAADTVSDYLFSDEAIIDALSLAQNQFTSRTMCLFDVKTVPVLAGDIFFDLPERTILIKSALFDGNLLTLVTQHELDYGYFSLNTNEAAERFSAWRTSSGIPRFLITDLGPLSIRMVPVPTTDGTTTIERYHMPSELSLIIDPVIPVQFHRSLVIGALAYLYDDIDADSYAPDKAMATQVQWERKLQEAEIQLQTVSRIQRRYLELPDRTVFKQEKISES